MEGTVSDARAVARFTSRDATAWMEFSGMSLADVVNEDESPEAKLGAVGFTRAPRGASSEFEFAYDEVLIVTKGACSIHSGGTTLRADVGEVLYLPAGVSGQFHADEDVELVYVASSPYGEVNREMKASLLGET